jgi:hypothetical protein
MGEILGIGCTHYPSLLRGSQAYTGTTRFLLNNPVVSDKMRSPTGLRAPKQSGLTRRKTPNSTSCA